MVPALSVQSAVHQQMRVVRSQRLGERNDAAFGRGIGRFQRTDQTQMRCHVDDGTTTRLDHVGDAVAAGQEGVQQVQRDGLVPDVEVHLMHRTVVLRRTAGAVEQHIEFAEMFDGGGDGVAHVFILCDVSLHEQRVAAGFADFAFGAFARIAVQFADRHARAFACAHFCGRLCNTGAGAGQEYHFAFESTH